MSFKLALNVYEEYKFGSNIDTLTLQAEELRQLSAQKPDDVLYAQSPQFKTLYAKESLGLYEPGEQVIALTGSAQVVEQGEALLMTDTLSSSSVLNQSNPVQWREYFFGETLTTQ